MAKTPIAISIPNIKLERHVIYLIGTAPLIVHAFPEKARKQMLDKQMKNATGGRDARDPYAEVEAARYQFAGKDGVYRDGFPAAGFKASAVTACTSLADVTKVAARQAFQVQGEASDTAGVLENSFVRTALIPLAGSPPMIREDVVRLSGPSRSAEMRYRPEYADWGVRLPIMLNAQVISAGHLGSMFMAAGHGVGIGDYRPEKDGDCGTFTVVSRDQFHKWAKDGGYELPALPADWKGLE